MDKSIVVNYVCEHATVQETLSRNVYTVRFPNPHSARFFKADDPETLVEKVWSFVQTTDGRKSVAGLDFSAYTDENYSSEGEEE